MAHLANAGAQVVQPGRPLKGGSPSVLVVDDETLIRRFLGHWLRGWGFPVSDVGSATEALEAMLSAPSDIVLCDIKMPGRDGMWLAERLHRQWPHSVTIITTGVMDLDVVMQCQRLGAIDYVTKPFGRELMLQALARATTTLEQLSLPK